MLCAGQVYQTTVTVQGSDTQPAAAILSITDPSGNVTTPPPAGWTTDGQGNWTNTYDYLLPAPGLYQFAWTTLGPDTAPVPDFINVSAYRSIVSIADTRTHLKKTSTATDDELAQFMMAATELVESKVGPCVPTQYVDRVDRGRVELTVPHKPIIAVSLVASIWPGGPQWDASVLEWDGPAGVIYQVPPFDFWWPPYDVTYTGGRQVIPGRLQQAALEQIRHLWETQRGGQPPAVLQGEQEFTTTTGWSFSVPRRVLELLEQDMVPSS